MKGFGTVVTGTLVSGPIRQDDELSCCPQAVRVKVRGLQVHGRREGGRTPARRVAVNLGGVEVADLARGDTLCTPGAFEPTPPRRRRRRRAAAMRARLRHGARVRFHQGTTELLGRVAIAARPGGQRSQPSKCAAADRPYVADSVSKRRPCSRAATASSCAPYSPSVTIGGGIVLDPHPPRSAHSQRRRRAARFGGSTLPGAAPVRDESAVLAFVDERGAAGLRAPRW